MKSQDKASKNKLFIIMGSAGAGKSTFAHFCAQQNIKRVNVIKKYTIRQPRRDEDSRINNDFTFISENEYSKLLKDKKGYHYVYGEDKKFVETQKILDSVQNFSNSVIIIGDIYTMKLMKKDLLDYADIYSVWIDSKIENRLKRFKKLKYTEQECLTRKKNCGVLWEFISTKKDFDYIISNDKSIEDFYIEIIDFIKKNFK